MDELYVVKRDGSRAPVRFDAITDRNEALCAFTCGPSGRSLDFVRARLPAITQEIVQSFKNGMTTHDLDMLTASVCAARATHHQDFGDLAARIVVSDLQKATPASMRAVVARLRAARDGDGRSLCRLSDEFVAIVERAGEAVDRRLDFMRDYNMPFFGIQTMVQSYLLREAGDGSPVAERPQHAYMRVAIAVAMGQADGGGAAVPDAVFGERLERAFAVYDMLSTQRLTHASPTMFNAGTTRQQLSSCYLLSVADDLDALLQVVKDAGLISKLAGGIGIDLTPIRAEGSVIRSTGGASGGLRKYLPLLDAGKAYVNQGGRRPGAYAVYLEPWHADVFTFLEMGRFKDYGASNAPGLMYALWVPDMFMEAVQDELDGGPGDWHLFCPDRAPGLHEAFGDEFRALHARYVAEGRYTRVVKASAVVTAAFETMAQRGFPYWLFKDHINRKSNLSHYMTINCSNLCVSGDTLVLTDRGHLKIADLVDTAVRVWNGAEWSEVVVRMTAAAANLVRVKLSNGASIECTPEHKFYDKNGTEIRAGNLIVGTQLEKAAAWPVIEGYAVPADDIPLSAPLGVRTKWVTDTLVAISPGPGRVAVRANPDLVLVLCTLGVYPRTVDHLSVHYLELTGRDIEALTALGVNIPEPTPVGPLEAPCGVRVVSVCPVPDQAATYCFTEPLRNRGVFNGVLTGQCAEITLPSKYDAANPENSEYGVCNLAAIPLATFVVPDARAAAGVRVDWAGIAAAAGQAVENLDNVISINEYPVAACRRSNMRHRPVAVGVMGLADVFAKFRIAYGSAEAAALDRAVHAAVYYGAMARSAELGAALGSFESFPGSAAQRGLIQPDLWVACGHLEADWADGVAAATGGFLSAAKWDALRAACARALRNSYVTADMPTATSSQVAGQNECFEPFTSNVYKRKTLAGEFTVVNHHLLAEMQALGLWCDETRRALVAAGGSVQGLPVPDDVRRRYRTARELDQRLLTRHAKARNPFLSQTQSLNYFRAEARLPDYLTVLLGGWREGLTTGVYYTHTQPAAGARKTAIAAPADPPPAAKSTAVRAGPWDAPASQPCEEGCTSCSV